MSRKNLIIWRIACLILTAIIGTGSLSIEAQAQSSSADFDSYGRWVNGVSEPWWFPESLPRADIAAVQQQWTAIGKENGVPNNNLWAGDYFVGGDTHGSYLRWSRDGFVLFHVDKCAARVMGFSYGKVISSPTLIEFLQGRAVSESPGHEHSTLRFLPVIWRYDKYLVPENAIEAFADYVAGLGEYNDPNLTRIEFAPFFSRSDREPAEVGMVVGRKDRARFVEPIVPPGYERFIKPPVEAKIIAKGKSYIRHNAENDWWDDLVIPVTINAGSTSGLKTNMSLRVVGREGFVVKTTTVRRYSASGVIAQPVRKRPCVKFDPTDDCKDMEYQPVKRGSRVTTNPVLEDPELAG